MPSLPESSPTRDIHITVTDEDGASRSITQSTSCGSEGGGDGEKMPSLVPSEGGDKMASDGEGDREKMATSQGEPKSSSTEHSSEVTDSPEDAR